MALHALDDFNEFFDFDQLESDHGGSSIDSHCQHFSTTANSEDVMAIDWATSEPAPQATSDVCLSQDLHMHNAFDDFQLNDHMQWPSTYVPYHFETSGQAAEGLDLTATSVTCLHKSLLRTATPLSVEVDDVQNGVNGHNDLGQTDTFDLRLETSLPAVELPRQEPTTSSLPKITASSRTQPAAPLRHASTASWKPASAKRKGPQSRIPLESRQILEDEFAANPYPCGWEMDIIAHQANLEVKKVRNWFNNTRARKKDEDADPVDHELSNELGQSLKGKLSRDSLEALEALDKLEDDDTQPPQPLAVYLAQSYQEEAVASAVQAAIDVSPLSGSSDYDDAWSGSRQGRRGSVITSVASSEGTALTTYTVSSSGSRSNISSFGRDRRRGRRRMAWKESPYNSRPKFNGVNSAGEPQKDLPFFCTFCPRAFKTRYEWVRHEDSVHALRTTWICCDTKNTPLESCPFCGQIRPDDDHMAGHKYHQCRSKPESQRTFYRRDHFVQHLHHVHFTNTKHPSVRAGCQARLLNEEAHNFGCKELAMKWRRFGAPMKRDDPMLHCGMCGKISRDWAERSIHVAEHLVAREHDRSVWWPERKENHLENLYSDSPFESFRCRYCLKIFTDIAEMNAHSHCKVWSCRFLKSFDDVTADNAGPPLCPDFPSAKAHHCHLCGAGYRTPHAEHAQSYHRHRSCNQEFYTSEETFLQHLHLSHGASHPSLLRGSSIIEQNFMRNKGASFEPLEFNESWQPCLMDLDNTPIGPFSVEPPSAPLSTIDKKEQTHTRKQSVRKKSREEHLQASAGAAKTQRQRSDLATYKTETSGPRFFRLSTYVPYISSRIFFSHHSKPLALPRDEEAVLEEMPKPHVAALVMSAGLVGMAAGRLVIRPQKHFSSGMIELMLEGEG
ncbi:hypothetical protein CC86DRAFT_295586 [Ophiobolus disseminans]|uniref:Homeobox domain-containing protein n=1 Tax=Ophiobolus disseminans TaxID=1469910 RepID=A0A6A6ZVA9_9PLEO|nr:hypothetical protein CC86DRAFT_295586 [Ophiobolus disseminans]